MHFQQWTKDLKIASFIKHSNIFYFKIINIRLIHWYLLSIFQLTALQDELLVKNGEIKVLRDALHQSEYSLEHQKTAHVQLENERTQLQSEKEKEFLKKVCIWECVLCD